MTPTTTPAKRCSSRRDRWSATGLGATDASVIAVAERHRAAEIATLDHRHFHVVRPRHVDGFTLLP